MKKVCNIPHFTVCFIKVNNSDSVRDMAYDTKMIEESVEQLLGEPYKLLSFWLLRASEFSTAMLLKSFS